MSAQYDKRQFGQQVGFLIPKQWPFTGDFKRREPVLDQDNRNRVVRLCGWKRCINCKNPFWSEDIRRHQICGGFNCQLD